MSVTARAPDPAAFAPFGAFIQPPKDVGAQSMFGEWLKPVPGLSQHYYLNRVTPSTLPMTLERVERHPLAAQLFLPIGVSRYVVTVMPANGSGDPEPSGALSFVVPGTLGVVYHPGIWHAGITALDAEATFAVLMWRGGGEDDVFASIPPLVVQPPDSPAGGAVHG